VIICLYPSGARASLVANEGRAYIAEIRAGCLCRKHGTSGGDRARKRERSIEPLSDFLDEGKGREHAGMSAGAGCDRDNAVRALLDRLVREFIVDDVVHHDAAIGVHRRVDVFARAERGDHDRHLVLDAS